MGTYPVFNVLDFSSGVSIGDGVAHPLSTTFADLAAAQAIYPRATDPAESLAWHAHQKAIDTAAAAGGGSVCTPAGWYIMSPCPKDLVFPMCADGAASAQLPVTSNNVQVNWIGEGSRNSKLEWTLDAGSGTPMSGSPVGNAARYAVRFGKAAGNPDTPANGGQQDYTRYGAFNFATSYGLMRGIHLIGPARALRSGDNDPNNTSNEANMSGICWASRRRLEDVRSTWFWTGIDVVGDHTVWDNCRFTHNRHGIWINNPSPNLYGDLSVTGKTISANNRFSCIGIARGAQLGPWHFSGRTFLGTSPYAFWKQGRTGTSSGGGIVNTIGMIFGCQFDALFLESIGNAYFWDEEFLDGGTALATVSYTIFQTISFSGFNSSSKISARGRSVAKIGDLYGSEMRNISYQDIWTGCTLPMFDLTSLNGRFLLSGNIEGLLSGAASAGVQPFNIASSNVLHAKRFKLDHTAGSRTYPSTVNVGPWTGCFANVPNGNTVDQKDAVTSIADGVQQAVSGRRDAYFAGIAMTSSFPNNAATGTPPCFVAIAEVGEDLPVKTASTFTTQKLKKLSTTAGGLIDADTAGDGRVVGYASALTNTVSLRQIFPDLDIGLRKVETTGTSTYTTIAADLNKVKRMTLACVVTLHADAKAGFEMQFVQDHPTGTITFAAASGATIRMKSGVTQSGGRYTNVNARCLSNVGGTAAEWQIYGELVA